MRPVLAVCKVIWGQYEIYVPALFVFFLQLVSVMLISLCSVSFADGQ